MLTTRSQEHETGVTRLALTDEDRQARDWFAQTTTELGCKLSVDEMGNMLAVRPGKKDGPPTCAGSHLDTQPTGGRYVSEPSESEFGSNESSVGWHIGGLCRDRGTSGHERKKHRDKLPSGSHQLDEVGGLIPPSYSSVCLTNDPSEEGARFPVSMVSSGVWSGRIPLQQAHNLKEVGDGSSTMKSELQRIGYLGKVPASFEGWPIAVSFKLIVMEEF